MPDSRCRFFLILATFPQDNGQTPIDTKELKQLYSQYLDEV